MNILATDLDRTLLPNGKWEPDAKAIEIFNKVTRDQGVFVVYVTGRNLDLTLKAIAEYGVRFPNILCGDVGTSIRRYEDGQWTADPGWDQHVLNCSPRWDIREIKEKLESIEGLRQQEEEHLNPFKQSYYVDHLQKERILKQVDEAIKGQYDEVIIYSFDSMNGKGLLDILPDSATKQTSLEYVARAMNVPKEDVVFCGDSGNDIFPLTAGFRGVLVRNADEQLVENVKKAQVKQTDLKVYFAEGGFKGLNGYYTSGVLEGACHYGILKEW